MKRVCVDCGADISHRFSTTKYCLSCGGKRNRQGAAKVTAAVRRAGKRRGGGHIRKLKTGGWRAEIRSGGTLHTRRFLDYDKAEQWCAEMAAER